jgi:hypothetical protein
MEPIHYPGKGMGGVTFLALQEALNAGIAMLEASKAVNKAFDAFFVSMPADENLRKEFLDAQDAVEAKKSFFDHKVTLLGYAADSPEESRDQRECIGEYLTFVQEQGSQIAAKAARLIRYKAA